MPIPFTVVGEKPHNITTGVIDKNVQTHEDLRSVTYRDLFGTLHTVHAHIDGPYKTAEDIMHAAEVGTLHTFESHDAAVEYWKDKEGNDEFVKLLRSLTEDKPDEQQSGRGGY